MEVINQKRFGVSGNTGDVIIDVPYMGIITDTGILVSEYTSPNISLTDEGYLLCQNAVIAKPGVQEYTDREIPAFTTDGQVMAFRNPEEVFREESIASFEGMPITKGHPPQMVTADNWKTYAVGTVHNVRRENGLLVADLLISDNVVIKQVQDQGLKYLSCGYTSRIVELQDGQVDQTYIRGNHVALVTNPRAGDVCSITDSKPKISPKGKMMKKDFKAKVLGLMGLIDEKTEELAAEYGVQDSEEEVDPIEARFKAIEAMLSKIAEAVERNAKAEEKEVEDDEDSDVKDSDDKEVEDDSEEDEETPVADSFNTVIKKAEVLSPGIKVDTFVKDSTDKPNVAEAQRQILKALYVTDSGRKLLEPLLNGRKLDKLKGNATAILFNAAYSIKSNANNSKLNVTITDAKSSNTVASKVADINAAFHKANK